MTPLAKLPLVPLITLTHLALAVATGVQHLWTGRPPNGDWLIYLGTMITGPFSVKRATFKPGGPQDDAAAPPTT